ncbi:leucine-rich repeat neuronal protein 1-like [Daphnia carinata]|uniref:leucine-rich repeat neuronal protein 1-like n=1 Tax=Daphnia carinata TaxID=120202 RepID=UPI0025805017|nr:leucine-rich repeat neuronal protein 1-like [Daphnia carinata]
MAYPFYVVVFLLTTLWMTESQSDVSELSSMTNFSQTSVSEIIGSENITDAGNLSGLDSNSTQMPNTNSEENPFKSTICKLCACQDANPLFLIDCNGKSLRKPFLVSEWPSDIYGYSIEAKFDSNEYMELTQFPELPLSRLSYRGNGLMFIEKAAFKFLKTLEYLDLSENGLTHESINGNIFEGQFNEEDYEPLPLKTLKLGYNKIISIDKDAFNHLSSHLEILELNNNPLKVIDHQTAIAITTLRKLKKLNLAETGLASVPSGLFHALPALKMLILAGNQFTTVPEELQHAIHLEYFNFNNNPIKSLDANSFQGLSQLKHLNMSSMRSLEWIAANTFTPLTSMTHLWCSFNPLLKEIDPGAFSNMAEIDGTLRLSEFHFRGNNLRKLPIDLLPWASLEQVDVGENPFTCDCNVGWVVAELLPFISEKTPELTTTLRCAEPEDYKDVLLDSLGSDAKIVNCTNPADSTTSDYDNSHDTSGSINPKISSNKGLIIVTLFGIISIVGGMACFVLLAVRKSHLRQLYDTNSGQIVHYVRTAGGSGKREDEQAIVYKEFNQYHQDP